MSNCRIPGILCVSNSSTPELDLGTLIRWSTPPPGVGQVCLPPPPKEWHNFSKKDGFEASTLTMSPEAVALLQGIETLRLKPYDDQTSKDITAWVKGATIGYGHLIPSSQWGTYKNGITKAQADLLFLADAKPFESTVGETITVGLQQYQFDALVILAFNIGQTGFRNSSVAKLVNNPKAKTNYSSLEKAWKAFNKTQGKESKGLNNRRAAEWKIYTQAVYERW